MDILLINLKRRHDRLAAMQQRLRGMDHEVVEAVDAEQWQPEHPPQESLYPLTHQELACIESHKKICRLILERQTPYTCVLEDDVLLSPDFHDFISHESWIPKEAKLIKIETFKQRVWLSRNSTPAKDRLLCQLHSFHPGTAGYILSLEGAKILLGMLETPDQAADDICFKRALEDSDLGKVLQLDPAICVQEFVVSEDCNDSDIATHRHDVREANQAKPSAIAKWMRELKRPFAQAAEKMRRITQCRRVVEFQ